MARLAAIKAKREEVRKMQVEFVSWLKENKIDPKNWETKSTTPTLKINPSTRVSPAVRTSTSIERPIRTNTER